MLPNAGSKKSMTIEDLNAYAQSYVAPVSKTQMTKIVFMSGATFSIISIILFFRWWLAIPAFAWGLYFGQSKFLPMYVKRIVESKAYTERNRFVNNFTQIISSKNKPFFEALKDTVDRLSPGTELQEDFTQLLAMIVEGSETVYFKELIKKYKSDEAFSQYIEQMSVTHTKGPIAIETMKHLNFIHNDNKVKSDTFLRVKRNHSQSTQLLFTMVMFIPMTLIFIGGFQGYIDMFAHSIFANVFSIIWIMINYSAINKYIRFYYDDDIMEVSL